MPEPDPLSSPRHSTMQRFWRIFRLLALLSIVVAAFAVALVTAGAGEIHGIGKLVLLRLDRRDPFR